MWCEKGVHSCVLQEEGDAAGPSSGMMDTLQGQEQKQPREHLSQKVKISEHNNSRWLNTHWARIWESELWASAGLSVAKSCWCLLPLGIWPLPDCPYRDLLSENNPNTLSKWPPKQPVLQPSKECRKPTRTFTLRYADSAKISYFLPPHQRSAMALVLHQSCRPWIWPVSHLTVINKRVDN